MVENKVRVDRIKFWCQKILPLVYDDSLSYYEVLDKVVDKLNETIDYVNDDVLIEIQNFINEYFMKITYNETTETINLSINK